jgi:hypothetical protein
MTNPSTVVCPHTQTPCHDDNLIVAPRENCCTPSHVTISTLVYTMINSTRRHVTISTLAQHHAVPGLQRVHAPLRVSAERRNTS